MWVNILILFFILSKKGKKETKEQMVLIENKYQMVSLTKNSNNYIKSE